MQKNLRQPLDLKAKIEQDIEKNFSFISCYLSIIIAFYINYIKQYYLTSIQLSLHLFSERENIIFIMAINLKL